MTEILKMLLEQPKKIRLYILNLSKILLTMLIVHGVIGLFEFNIVRNFLGINTDLHIGKILLYLLIMVGSWFIIWYFFEPLFTLLISLRTKKSKEYLERKQREERKGIGRLLKLFGAVSVKSDDFIVPGDNVHDLADFAEFIDKNNALDMASSAFSEILYLLFVGWIYLLFNSTYLELTICAHLVMAAIFFILIVFYRTLDDLLSGVKIHSRDVRIFLDEMEFKKFVMDTVLHDFRGHINCEDKSFDLNWGMKSYRVYAFYHHPHEGIANGYLLKRFGKANQPDYSDAIIVLNHNPNEEVKALFQSKNIGGFVVANEENELIDNLVAVLNELKATQLLDSGNDE